MFNLEFATSGNQGLTPLIICGLAMVASYFVGNISPAILLGKFYGVDIKKEGSGNAGTTNVLRVLGKKAAVMTLVIDIAKGVIAVVLGRAIGQYFLVEPHALYLTLACGLLAFYGHIWPAVFGFKGGKGVATAFGVIVAVDIKLGLTILGIVLLIVLLTRRTSVGSIVGALCFPALAYIFNPQLFVWGLVMAMTVLFKHRANIIRLIKGEEPKLNFKK